MMIEYLPKKLRRVEALDRVLEILRGLPVSDRIKKRALMEWAVEAGVKVTAEMVERATGRPAGEV